MLKEGDILICKKHLFYYDDLACKKNKSYKIYMIFDVLNDLGENIDYFMILSDSGAIPVYDNNKNINNKYVYDYFYTQQELRLLKLESL